MAIELDLLRLPSPNHTFSEIRNNDKLYVDKTESVYELLTSPTPTLLARPPKFGKSLLISTLIAALEGKRDLFKGLWIDQSDYDWRPIPIVRLNLENLVAIGPDRLDEVLRKELKTAAEAHNVVINGQDAKTSLANLLTEVQSENKSERIAIIISGYDHLVMRPGLPISDAQKIWAALNDFYQVATTFGDSNFVFLTGEYDLCPVTKSFSESFSDNSLYPKLASVCGFTVHEFDQYFAPILPGALKVLKDRGDLWPHVTEEELRDRIFTWYGGYSWDGQTKLLNPYSTINFFKYYEFKEYWYHDTSLSNPIYSDEELAECWDIKPYLTRKIGVCYSCHSLRIDRKDPGLLMLHHGYLTSDHYVPGDTKPSQKLFLPNLEITASILPELLDLTKPHAKPYELYAVAQSFFEAFLAKDAASLDETFLDFSFLIPPKTPNLIFSHYQRTIFFLLALAGQSLIPHNWKDYQYKPPTTDPAAEALFNEHLFDYALELDLTNENVDNGIEKSFAVIKFRDITDPDEEKRVKAESFPKEKILKFLQAYLTEGTPVAKIKVTTWLIYFHDEREGIQSTLLDL